MVSLDEEALLRAASRVTGLDDYGDDWFREPFRVFLRALEDEAQLTLLGRLLARSEVQRILQNRLRVEDTLRRNPEISGERIEKPIFVTGLGRSGTTLLHELLRQDPANRVPMQWETMYSVPPPETATYHGDPRIQQAHLEVTIMDEIAPAFPSMHEIAGDLPTECIFIFAHQLVTDMFIGSYYVPSYAVWTSTADPKPAYDYHRKFLQLLQWRHRGERWVLKAPSHLAHLPQLFATYPDARVVITHRDPLRVLGSLCNLMATLHWMRSDVVNYDFICSSMAFGFARLVKRVMKQRDGGQLPNDQIYDVRYGDLIQDPIGTVRRLYDHWGVALTNGAEDAMHNYLAAKPKGRRGLHEYSFADTGLDLASERAKYAEYQERYRVPSEV
jgi:hypothetical protein